ncbi:aminoglycoside phosphotransferase family protein [Kineosporia sp. NBRC 101731]|uniref:aminoglycoside phosphotransferase family protein n=1 Tax=Kineosporia sp. NBRC 101731 TaxID=3032199 RepID=UPI0025574E9C|nr:aminoglycoside phosphotransferase family protein [Kineosporia sp. NBRC 101731]
MHRDQIAMDAAQVAGLVSAQFPRWAGLPVRRLWSKGTVNAVFRIGDELAARFPLRPGDPQETADGFAREAEAARKLAEHTRFRVPQSLALGEPGLGYPLPWAVQTWLDGPTGSEADPSGSAGFAEDLVELVRDLRGIGTGGRAFTGSGRGGNLPDHDDWMEKCFAESGDILDVPSWRRRWEHWRELPRTAPDTMNHGDLIPGNVLVSPEGRLTGVIDVGGFGPADPALDLISAWSLLDAQTRPILREGLDCDDLTWERGRAWAFEQAMGLGWYYATTNPGMSRLGLRMLDRLAETSDL